MHWPHPAWISTLTRSPMLNSSTSGPSAATVPIYSWPGVKFLLKGRSPPMLAGDPLWTISRSVAQIATASMRTRTSARPGNGVGLSRRKSSSGSPRTQAFISRGTGNSGNVLTPAGSYITADPCFNRRLPCEDLFLTPLLATAIGFSALTAAWSQSTPVAPAANMPNDPHF